MSDVYYARPVTVTEERLREANEKQAKQRALREALDSQRLEARGGPEPALTKAQQKRQEIMRYQAQQNPPAGLQPQYQSNSLPPNFSMSTSNAFGQQQNAMMMNGGNSFGQPPPVNVSSSFLGGGRQASSNNNNNGGYDSRSLPPDFGMMMQQQQQHHPPPQPPQGGRGYANSSPMLGPAPNNYSFGSASGVGGANFHYHPAPQQQPQDYPTPTHHQQHHLQQPNFNLAEVYASQQPMPMHAPQRELPVPISPRGMPAQHMAAVRSSNNQMPWGVGGGGGGAPAPVPSASEPSENIQHLLRMANRVTDQPYDPQAHQPTTAHSRAGGGDRVSRNGAAPQSRRGGGGDDDAPSSGPMLVPQRAQSKEARGPAGRPPAPQSNTKQSKVAESRVEKLQKELADKQYEMQRMREKERNWEEQVKQLKDELKNARQKERDMSKFMNEKPQRAETAPNTGSIGKLAPLQQQQQQPLDPRRGGLPAPVAADKAKRLAPNQQGGGGMKIPPSPTAPQRKDFNNARVFNQDTFRPITAPLEPIVEDVRMSSTKQLPPLPESLKMASFNTRRIAFGLQQTGQPVTLTLDVLFDFVDSQVITRQQAEGLWSLFADLNEATDGTGSSSSPPVEVEDQLYDDGEEEEDDDDRRYVAQKKRPSPPPGSRPNHPSNRRPSNASEGSPTLPNNHSMSSSTRQAGAGRPAQLRTDDLRRPNPTSSSSYHPYEEDAEDDDEATYRNEMRNIQTKRPAEVSSRRTGGTQLHSPTYETYADLQDDDDGDYD